MKSLLMLFLILLVVLTACFTASTHISDSPKSFLTATKIPTASSTLTPSITPTFENIETLRAVIQATRQAEGTSTQAVRNLTATLLALTPSSTPTVTSTPTKTLTGSPTPTVDTTQQTWHATAIAIRKTENAVIEQAWNDKATQIAQFPAACEDTNFPSGDISPDGKWFAASCGRKRNQMLVVQDNEGTRWVLEFVDFLSPDSPDGIWGSLNPKSWSPDGEYLYFTIGLGYSGGGNDCFSGFGEYGLFRLSLNTGLWTTLIPSTDSFGGYEIKFSPTGQHYAIVTDGVMITDLETGEYTKMDISDVININWSPDGKYLAYSVASCGEWHVQSSSVYVWDVLTNQTQILITTEEILLRPESWIDNSTLRIEGEKFIDLDAFYTIYEYDITQDRIVFSGTATPSP